MLVPEDNGNQNLNESYTNEYQKHVACSFCYKLVCVDGKFSIPFQSKLGEDSIYNFISSIIEEIKDSFTHTPCYFFLNNSKTVKAVTLAVFSI